MAFLDNFLSLCKNKGEAPTKVLLNLGMSKGNFGKWKEGRVPKAPQLKLIASYFNVSVDYLLDTEKAVTPSDDGLQPDDKDKEILALFEQLSPADQDKALAVLKALIDAQ